MFARFISSSTSAVIVTSALLLMMAGLIPQQAGPTGQIIRAKLEPWIAPIIPDPIIDTRDRPDRPPPPEVKPETEIDNWQSDSVLVAGGGSPSDPPMYGVDRISLDLADGELMPIVTVAPNYPESAVRRRLEGFVIIEFRVTRNGSVDNIRVVESTSSVFERAAINAVGKFRFRPRVINGEPVAVAGVRRRITFTLQNQ